MLFFPENDQMIVNIFFIPVVLTISGHLIPPHVVFTSMSVHLSISDNDEIRRLHVQMIYANAIL